MCARSDDSAAAPGIYDVRTRALAGKSLLGAGKEKALVSLPLGRYWYWRALVEKRLMKWLYWPVGPSFGRVDHPKPSLLSHDKKFLYKMHIHEPIERSEQ